MLVGASTISTHHLLSLSSEGVSVGAVPVGRRMCLPYAVVGSAWSGKI
jgi:hypothetical protein